MEIDIGTTTSANTIFGYVGDLITSFQDPVTLIFGVLLFALVAGIVINIARGRHPLSFDTSNEGM